MYIKSRSRTKAASANSDSPTPLKRNYALSQVYGVPNLEIMSNCGLQKGSQSTRQTSHIISMQI